MFRMSLGLGNTWNLASWIPDMEIDTDFNLLLISNFSGADFSFLDIEFWQRLLPDEKHDRTFGIKCCQTKGMTELLKLREIKLQKEPQPNKKKKEKKS
ncbi:hypothetical protein RclHR1_00400012 [Rhizophagus clarus]|uniref:Uncharacterized protein n=1 Tax=Rhizophagus clarus TaxID=94130 RepID=A0A2Z6RE59_9GLOM|nr:hypothetical protein RclHR1_00400012 [Rhizophagus clarus]